MIIRLNAQVSKKLIHIIKYSNFTQVADYDKVKRQNSMTPNPGPVQFSRCHRGNITFREGSPLIRVGEAQVRKIIN